MDEALSPNAREGAVLDYFLKDRASSSIQLEILDSEGKLVRRFASDDVVHKTNPNDVPIQMEWVRDPKPLLAEAGRHRVGWDLFYAVPKSVPSSFWGPSRPLAVPGNDTAERPTNGTRRTRPPPINL